MSKQAFKQFFCPYRLLHTKEDEHGFKRIWLKQTVSYVAESQNPPFSSNDAFENYIWQKANQHISQDRKGSADCLGTFIRQYILPEWKPIIASLYGKPQFTEDIFAEIDFLEITEDESKNKFIQLRQIQKEQSSESQQPALQSTSGEQVESQIAQDEKPSEDETETKTQENQELAPPHYSANEKAKLLLEKISSGLYSKEEAVRLSLLAAVACESVFFLGPPGVAKSMICQRLSEVFRSGEGEAWFEYLMNQFSTPDEIFGPVSLKALENDEYKKITKNYLPEANVAFLDEIWKASPAIQNTLLTIINEKKFHNGNKVQKVPLKVLVAASNELPASGLGLEALWDRFLIRVLVNPIEDEDEFFDMIESTEETDIKIEESLKISQSELKEWRDKINEVEITQEIREVIKAIRKEMTLRNEAIRKANEEAKNKQDTQEEFYVSDRRWKKIVNILRTSAFLNGREAVDLMDCQLITYCIWNTENQQQQASEIVRQCVEQHGLAVTTKISDLEADKDAFDKKVISLFYTPETTTTAGKPITKKHENRNCYECEKGGRTFYITANKVNNDYYGRNYIIYDTSGNSSLIDYSISDDKTTINVTSYNYSWASGSYTVNFTTGKTTTQTVKDDSVFGKSDVYNATKMAIDANYYNTIKANIEAEIEKIDNFISRKQKPFDENLFADQSMKEVIMKKVSQSKLDLQKLQVKLDEVRGKYAQ